MIGWVNLSINRNFIDNTAISSSFAFISIPLCYAVCIAAKRKLLPYGLLQLFTGILILLMIAFQEDETKECSDPQNNPKLATIPVFIAHVANVLVSAALSVIWVLSIETFPQKYRSVGLAIYWKPIILTGSKIADNSNNS